MKVPLWLFLLVVPAVVAEEYIVLTLMKYYNGIERPEMSTSQKSLKRIEFAGNMMHEEFYKTYQMGSFYDHWIFNITLPPFIVTSEMSSNGLPFAIYFRNFTLSGKVPLMPQQIAPISTEVDADFKEAPHAQLKYADDDKRREGKNDPDRNKLTVTVVYQRVPAPEGMTAWLLTTALPRTAETALATALAVGVIGFLYRRWQRVPRISGGYSGARLANGFRYAASDDATSVNSDVPPSRLHIREVDHDEHNVTLGGGNDDEAALLNLADSNTNVTGRVGNNTARMATDPALLEFSSPTGSKLNGLSGLYSDISLNGSEQHETKPWDDLHAIRAESIAALTKEGIPAV